jgi:hypothetical protein
MEKHYSEVEDRTDISEKIGRAIFEFNKKIRETSHNTDARIAAWKWLGEQKEAIENEFEDTYGFHMDFTFNFLYPETCCDLPDTYEEWKAQLEKYKLK